MKLNRGVFHCCIVAAILISSLCISVSGQAEKPAHPISAGVLNGKALTLPKPDYPEEARKAGGTVQVQVLIDETGKVISAKTLSGPENVSLRAAARAAALKATFSPTLLAGKPVKVSGVIEYNFAAESSNEEKLEVLGVSAFLVIVGSSASDLDKLKLMFDERELFNDEFSDFPHYKAELRPLLSLEKLSVGERVEAIGKAFSLIRSRLSESEKWQFEVGKNLGEILGSLMVLKASSDDRFDVSKVDDPQIKLNLNKIRDLTLSAPPEFPEDVLKKLKVLAALGVKPSFKNTEDFEELFAKIDELINAISPDETN